MANPDLPPPLDPPLILIVRLCSHRYTRGKESYPICIVRTATALNWNKLFTHIEHRTRAGGWEGLALYILILTPEYLLPSQWTQVLFPTYSLPLRSEYLVTPHQIVAVKLSDMWRSNFRDRRAAAAWLCYSNRTEITVLTCEQRPYQACAGGIASYQV